MLRGMIEDIVFHNPAQTEIGDLGYIPAQPEQFFINQRTIVDARTSRLPITYRNNEISYSAFQSYIIQDTYDFVIRRHYLDPNNDDDIAIMQILLAQLLDRVNNQMTIGNVFTIDRAMSMKVYYDQQTLDNSDNAYLAQMSQSEYNGLFNIIEKLTLGITYQESMAEVDAALRADTTKYMGYKAGSVVLSNKRMLGHVYDGVDIDVIAPPSIRFTITKMGGIEMDVQLWLSRTYFEQEYPFSAIVDVVPPADLNTLLNLDSLDSSYKGLLESRETVDEHLDSLIKYGYTYSGWQSIIIQYISQIDGSKHDTKFSIIYRGAQPTILAIKQAIKTKLVNSGIGTEEDWRARFPSLFIDNSYYIYPIWDEAFSTANRTLYRSILSDQKRNIVLNQISNLMDHVNLSDVSILNGYYNASYSLALPDINNENTISLVHQLADYTRISPTNEVYNALSADSKKFITLFNQALAKGNGETNNLEIVALDNYQYVRFIIEDKEFFVITKQSYNAMMLGIL